MLYVLVWFGSLKFQQILCQFAPHMDFQKIDEIMYDNSKYNVLKPTIHITRDHFKDFILNRHNSDFSGKKVIIDKNGIRHYWSGYEAPRPKSLRKAILETDTSLHEAKAFTSTKTENIAKDNDNTTDKIRKVNDTKKSEAVVKVKAKPRRKKKVTEPISTVAIDKVALRKDKSKVKATFFCPFFGVVTMMSYID